MIAGAYKRYRTSRVESLGMTNASAVTPAEPMALSLWERSVIKLHCDWKVGWECIQELMVVRGMGAH
jgi:hypothetical protein